MATRYLITASLLNSWQYLINTEENYEGALQGFLDALDRKPFEGNEHTRRGYEFEEWAMANYEPTQTSAYQVTASKELTTCNGTTFLVYGRMDAVDFDHVYDYKCPATYEYGDYFANADTPIYLYISDCSQITYVVGHKNSKRAVEEGCEPFYVVGEESIRADELTADKTADGLITAFENWLKVIGYWERYTNLWKAR